MVDFDDLRTGVSSPPPIPEGGLLEVLASWSGRGSIWEALAIPMDVNDRRWSARDIERRAHRVLFEHLVPHLKNWPTRLREWIDILPAAREHARVVSDTPFAGVSWPTSRTRFGWLPTAFVGRQAERSADMLLVTTLKWTLESLQTVYHDATTLYPEIADSVSLQINAATSVLQAEPVASARAQEPRNPELLSLRREGAPWGAVSKVASELRDVEFSKGSLVSRILMPDDQIRWRLFHLGVLGVVLSGLRAAGCSITSLRPLRAASPGPAFSVRDDRGRKWDLWFEASGIWSSSKRSSPYVEATAGFPGADRTLGADILLLLENTKAVIFECKYSEDANRVARSGYYQAMTYAAEARSRLCDDVISVAIGPEGIVESASFTDVIVGRVGTSPPSGIAEVLLNALRATAAGSVA